LATIVAIRTLFPGRPRLPDIRQIAASAILQRKIRAGVVYTD
jgi:hypothetical protein